VEVESPVGKHTNTRQTSFVVETISAEEQERFVSILSFWHKIEFFIPFDLDQRIAEADEHKIRYLHRQDLHRDSSTLWEVAVQEDEEVKLFRLYLGIFDKSEITNVCDQILGPSRDASDEEFERTGLEGRTCFAQLTIDPTGELVLESAARPGPVSYVSTLPWALGQFKKAGFANLTSDRFENAKQDLAGMLLNFKATRRLRTGHESGEGVKSLKHFEILELHEIFQNWAGFSVSEAGLIGILEIVTAKRKKEDTAAEHSDKANESDSANEEPEADIAILNSFFIQDIESAINSIKSGQIGGALKDFLSPLPAAGRVDLESASGLWAILDMLHPDRLNRGRWLSNADRSMTLMQQFAINLIAQGPADVSSLFSVNGPPGTGKTTLLQDTFADLIVRRARLLANLSQPSDAFLPDRLEVSFKGKQDRTISIFRPELTGFEMVVGSSNNAAVENISGDLPKVEKLGSLWRGSEYLKPVAYKVAAQQNDGSFKRLGDADQPWGLISCALGNSNNRTHFKERFCYMEVPRDRKPSWQIPDRPQNIREWIDNYRGPDFAAAKRHFKQKDAEVEKTCARLKSLADLLPGRLDPAHEEKISAARRSVEACRDENSRYQHEKQDLAASIGRLQNTLDNLREDERLLILSRPALWARIRRTSVAKHYKLQLSENASAQLRVRRALRQLKARHDVELHSRITVLSSNLGRLEDELKRAEAEKRAADQHFEATESEFASLPLPKKLDDLHADDFQKSGLWHLDVLAQQRSELFAAALSLHEAWLASVGKRKAGFRQNILAIADVLSGRRLENPSDALPIWQSLFLIVPIVSTTFASFHNQFADLGPASLGWLFIDEAGQAVPQAAVGALWRAKHAVVIGDPLQIEPVFTLPSRFISAVAELSPHTADGSYSPHKTSVQRLADNANKFGVIMRSEGGQGLWVGSPLRVHRRCIEPMFSWSNDIAYDGKMVFGLPSPCRPNGPPIPCESAWIDLKGNVRKRQEVAEQTQFVLELLVALYQKHQQLPGLYLISPFKAIKTELIKEILNLDWVNQEQEIVQPGKNELKKWCKERVGTVHTFQGKEEDTVLMILGADSKHVGSADWACAKPNILNVALTRAHRRFYVIGDRELWGAKGPFAWSVDHLPTMNARQFLAIGRNGFVPCKPTVS
jgi:uncharacterized small protein (DUF1192 family)